MSILSDILSRVKQQQPKRDVPPGLRSTVSAMRDGEVRRRKIFLLAIILVLFTGLGAATLYLADLFAPSKVPYRGRRDSRPSPATETPAAATAEKATPPAAPVRDSKVKEAKRVKSPAPLQPRTDNQVTQVATPVEPVEQPKAEQTAEVPRPAPSHEEPASGMKEAYIYSAEGHEAGGNLSDAVADYRKVLELEPNNYRVMNKIASLLIKMGRFDEAEKSLKGALNIRPDYLPALVNSGIASAKTGKTAEAEKALLKALTIDSNSQAALLNIALLYEKEKRYDQARDYFSKLRQLGDKNGELGLQRLEQTR